MEKQILFNTEMVKAILEDRKNTTRRIIKGVEGLDFIGIGIDPKEIENTAAFGHGNFKDIVNAKIEKHIKAPCLQEDILYVRETWNFLNCVECDGNAGNGCIEMPVNYKGNRGCFAYKVNSVVDMDSWKPSIHMPKEAARIFLKVKEVRVERIQDITEEQAINEGVGDLFLDYIANCQDEKYKVPMDHETLAIDQFELLWDSTIKKSDIDHYGWKSNPWVWVIEFERIER
ncbi:hypothetical protein [uncultured Clostridium sp.]|uniref:hypothetical protein n=1 Tax=uncultured Clostridium sp. TaxID=59620 RepID=UPI0028E6D567|nr:hypothetical protein [uncultured Clostridium sp.]